ncbi:MAG: hypothetical protein ACRDRJ_08140 [Streptosporangiaceae bacterium]
MTATTFRRKSGSYWTYTLDSVPRIKGVTTMMKGLGGPPESYFTEYTAGHAVDNWERLAGLAPSARLKEIAGATKARFSAAAVRGTAVHKLAEPLAHGQEVDVPDHLRGHVESCIQFLDDYDVEVIATETALFSRKHKYAGSGDLWATARKPGRKTRIPILGDWKTNASGPWGSVAFQFAGYRYADIMLSGDGGKDSVELAVPGVDECWCIWLRADGYEVYPMHVTPEVHRQLLYIDQCRMADEQCRDYKLDALPHPETMRKVRLADVEEGQ